MTQTPRPTAPNTGIYSNDALAPPGRPSRDGRTPSAASFVTAKSFMRNGPAPGSFTSELKGTISRPDVPRYEVGSFAGTLEDGGLPGHTTEQRQAEFRDKIEKETKIKIGTENLLEALNTKKEKHIREQRRVVESELNTSNRKIAQLKSDLSAEIQRSKELPMHSPKERMSAQLFRAAPIRSPPSQQTMLQDEEEPEYDPESESPSYILAEILQSLEAADLPSDYYVNHANELVELFKRHPTLKYDLAWSIFGLRMQVLLLSDNREVVAAGYRLLRYAITDRKSLQTIRSLHTDYLVILSLVKESKARVEREQALKFVRAFLDVKGGTKEIHRSVVRVLVAVADHADDQLRSIACLTLAEILLKDPEVVVEGGGVTVLSESMGNGAYHAPETLITPFMHLMDLPARRGMLRNGFEFSSAFASFTEPYASHGQDERLKASSRVIAGMFKSWSGLMTLSLHDFLPVRSVVSSLYISTASVREAVTDLIADILRIQFPSWASSFIGGRRLTTYGRVTNLRAEDVSREGASQSEEDPQKRNLVEHFIAVALAILLRQGLLRALMHAESSSPSVQLRKKTSLLLAKVLKMAGDLLPSAWSAELQVMPDLFSTAVASNAEGRVQATATVYEVDRVNRTLYRSVAGQASQIQTKEDGSAARTRAASKSQVEASMDEAQFRQKMLDTGVLNTVNYNKWNWSLIQSLIEGPMQNPKRLDEATRITKFVHRLLGFLRPFKFRFSDAPNTKVNQRYVRAGCSLVRTLLQTPDSAKYLADNKLIPQIAECLAQKDPMSGITSTAPLFSPERLSETLVGGYFAFLGVLCSDGKGLQILERWRIINMLYHIVELRDRDDLIMTLLTNLDYTLDSHPRIILAKAMIAGSKNMRMAATKILRKYAMMPIEPQTVGGGAAEWSVKLLVSQLYDPEIEVCEVAIKILEEACNNIRSLEYVVKCRPALDHLGEIGAPLLLRFLSTSVGYHYLDGLDYITKEMDDWFLGRNDSYVTLVEASLARALADVPEKPQSSFEDTIEPQNYGHVPPHFYRELSRTAEGCELLKAKGHFEEFAATIQDFATESEDCETILKVKGCLWAVGNVGSMELGAPFLENTEVVKYIVQIAETSEVMTLRGTAFFVLGLISRSLHGQEILAEHGWDGTVNVLGESLGYSLPLNFNKLFSLKPFANAGNHATIGSSVVTARTRTRTRSNQQQPKPLALATDPRATDPANTAILASIAKLGNSVLTNKAVGELNALKHRKKAPGFASDVVFKRALDVLSGHRFGVQQWRFVIDLFEKGVLRKIVLEEDESGSDSSSEDNTG
jgi:rapamycin-insensitive companion of mTOR